MEILPAPLLLHPQVGLPQTVLPATPPSSCISFLLHLLTPAPPSSCPPAPTPPAENVCPWHLVELGPGQEQAELLVIRLLTDQEVVPGRALQLGELFTRPGQGEGE